MERIGIQTPAAGSSTIRDRTTIISGQLRIINSDESYDETISTADSPHELPNTVVTLRDTAGTAIGTAQALPSAVPGNAIVPDKTYTDSDGQTVTQPAAAPIVCTLAEDVSFRIDGVEKAVIAPGDVLDVSVTLDGSPTTATYLASPPTIQVFNIIPTFDPDTTAHMTAIGMAADETVHYAGTEYEITGKGIWKALDYAITGKKDLNIYSVNWFGYTVGKEIIIAFYPSVGGTAARHRYNACDPRALSAAKYLTFNGSFTHDGGGVQGLGNGWAETNILIADIGTLGGGWCYNRSYSLGNTYDFGTLKSGGLSFAHCSRNNNSQIAYPLDASSFGESRFVQDSRGFSGFLRNTNAQAYWSGRQLSAPFSTAAGSGVNTNTIVIHAVRNFAGTPAQFRTDQYAGFLFSQYITPSKLTDLAVLWENFQSRLYRAAV